jgi:hypothetical protein
MSAYPGLQPLPRLPLTDAPNATSAPQCAMSAERRFEPSGVRKYRPFVENLPNWSIRPLAEVPNLVAEVGLEHKSSRSLFRKLTPARMGADLSLSRQVE